MPDQEEGATPPSWIAFKTAAGNRYVHSRKINQFVLLHPVLYGLLRLKKEGVDLAEWFQSLPRDGTVMDDCGVVSKAQIEYYFRKYLLMTEHGYFAEVDYGARLGGRLTTEHVHYLLANVGEVVFEVTDDCNMACEYCGFGKYYAGYDERTGKYLDVSVARNLLAYLLEYWDSPLHASHNTPIHIGFYGGEPLLGFAFIREIVDAVRHQETAHRTFSFGMTTNGLLLGEYMDFLVENDFALLISLDGNEAGNAYRVLRSGKPAYSATVENVRALRDKYPHFFERKVKFNAVLHNKNSVAEVYTFFKDTFDQIPKITALSTVGIAAGKVREFREMFRSPYRSSTESARCPSMEADMLLNLPETRGLATTIFRCSGYSFRDYNELLLGRERERRVPTGTCLPFSRKLFLSVNGKILQCERIGHHNHLGEVDAEGVTLDPAEIAERTNRQLDAVRRSCMSCCDADTCGVCIHQMDVRSHQTDQQDPIECRHFVDSEDYSRHLSSQMSMLEASPEYYSRILDRSVVIG